MECFINKDITKHINTGDYKITTYVIPEKVLLDFITICESDIRNLALLLNITDDDHMLSFIMNLIEICMKYPNKNDLDCFNYAIDEFNNKYHYGIGEHDTVNIVSIRHFISRYIKPKGPVSIMELNGNFSFYIVNEVQSKTVTDSNGSTKINLVFILTIFDLLEGGIYGNSK